MTETTVQTRDVDAITQIACASASPSSLSDNDRACSPDSRFRALLGAVAWASLSPAVRARFARRAGPGQAITYVGTIVACHATMLGWLLAQLCRAIGAPLPLHRDIDVPAIVSVTEDAATGGQIWTRVYGRRDGFPQVIHSSKRFAGPTGLEEYLGRGVAIALTMRVDAGALIFRSAHYVLCVGRWRLRLPWLLGPGALTITHADRGNGRFAFILSLRHPVLGRLLEQTGIYREYTDPGTKEIAHDHDPVAGAAIADGDGSVRYDLSS